MNNIDHGNRWLTDACVRKLALVDHRLAAVVTLGIASYSKARIRHVRVTSGFRSRDEQSRLVKAGKSPTMESYHLRGCAVDLAILSADRSKAYWSIDMYRDLDHFIQAAASQVGHEDDIEWGGHWKSLDGVHWQLNLPEVGI